MSRLFEPGDRVTTPHGIGTVWSRRMKGPDYTEAASYSVRLDKKAALPNYVGTAVLASEVGSIVQALDIK